MNAIELKVSSESPYSPDAVILMNELSDTLESITGSSGKNSFESEDVCSERSMFTIARDKEGCAVGCGAFRPLDEKTAEIKRMYAKQKCSGVGTMILLYLEKQAKTMGYSKIMLETRKINKKAVSFYERNGYQIIPNYGKYVNNEKCVCFEKSL